MYCEETIHCDSNTRPDAARLQSEFDLNLKACTFVHVYLRN